MINHIRCECSKIAQKEYKTGHNWAWKVIRWELCKKLKLYHINKWYMHNPESILDNEMHKLLWNFENQTDHLISSRRPDLVIINNKKKENLSNSKIEVIIMIIKLTLRSKIIIIILKLINSSCYVWNGP